jgi:hypothetical protein
MQTLQLLEELRTALEGSDPDAIWELVGRITADVETDRRAPKSDLADVRRLNSAVGEFLAARRDGLNADVSRPRVILTGLENSIKRRTTGPDGWPLA